MAKEISYDNETREKLAAGVAKLADTVRVTIGPKGRYVGVTKEGERHPYVSNDGATVAAHVGSRDRVEKMGLQVVREAATAANNEAGDGTSTGNRFWPTPSCARACATLPPAMTRWRCAAASRRPRCCVRCAVEVRHAGHHARADGRNRHRVLGRPEIGNTIAEALDEIGQDGVISVEKSTKFGISLDVKKGWRSTAASFRRIWPMTWAR